MGWERRGNRYYYYRKRREGSHVISEYIGRGELALIVAEFDQAKRARRKKEKKKWLRKRRAIQELDRQVDAFCNLARVLKEATLLAMGCHAHKGQWRKKRDG